jgi:dihydrodipicolinate synthase/N-acetylneuraminate lyase
MQVKPEGSFVAIVTPMNDDGSIDYGGFRTLLDWHRENGTEAILIMGSTGEVSMLTPEEKRAIISRTAKMDRGRMLLYFGSTGNNTDTTIDLVRYAEGEGGNGTANMTGNVIPREMAPISKKWESGEDAFACREAWLTNLPMLHFAYAAVNPVAVKTSMRAVGLPSGPLRKPLKPANPELLTKGLDIVARLGLDRNYGFATGPRALEAAE